MIPRATAELEAKDEALLSRLVATAFAQRRKMLRNNLKGVVDEGELRALGIDPTCRAEDVAVADYVRVANWLAEKNSGT
jgi:16S rRNA (adenine1518-N6/adenine1519-N6)-dimethyltransferase